MKLFDRIRNFFRLRIKRGVKVDIAYPICWENMSFDEFRNVCIILDHPASRQETLFRCLCALANIRPDNPIKYDPKALGDNVVFLIGNESYVISPKVISEACSQLGFIYDQVGLPPSPLDKVDRKLYGINFKQFFEADAFMLRYGSDGDEKWLKVAAKILSNGAVRKLLPWQKKGLVIWWHGVKKYLQSKYPAVFQESGEGGFSDKTMEDILHELLSSMTGDKPQQNDDILKSDVHSVLFCLNHKYEKDAHN